MSTAATEHASHAPHRPGGLSESRPVDDNVKSMVMKVRPDVEKKLSRSFTKFEPTEYSSQVRKFF